MRLSPSKNTQVNTIQLIQNITMRQTVNNDMFSQINTDLSKSLNVQHTKTKTNMLQNYLIHNKSIQEMSKSIYREKSNQGLLYTLKSSQQSLAQDKQTQTNLIKIYRQESIKNHLNGKRRKKQKEAKNPRTIFNDTLIKKPREFSFQKPINFLPEIQKYDQTKNKTQNIRKQKRNSGYCTNLLTINQIQNPQTKRDQKKNTLIDLIEQKSQQNKQKSQQNKINKFQIHFQQQKQRLLNEQLKRKKSNAKVKSKSIQLQRKYQSLEISSPKQENNLTEVEAKAETIQIRIAKRYCGNNNSFNPMVTKRSKKSRNSYSPWDQFRESKDAWNFQY